MLGTGEPKGIEFEIGDDELLGTGEPKLLVDEPGATDALEGIVTTIFSELGAGD